jgi:hypothetical protein
VMDGSRTVLIMASPSCGNLPKTYCNFNTKRAPISRAEVLFRIDLSVCSGLWSEQNDGILNDNIMAVKVYFIPYVVEAVYTQH